MKAVKLLAILAMSLMLTACVHKIITVPVKIAYKTTKAVVKGTIAVGQAIIPDDDDDNEKDDKDKKK